MKFPLVFQCQQEWCENYKKVWKINQDRVQILPGVIQYPILVCTGCNTKPVVIDLEKDLLT